MYLGRLDAVNTHYSHACVSSLFVLLTSDDRSGLYINKYQEEPVAFVWALMCLYYFPWGSQEASIFIVLFCIPSLGSPFLLVDASLSLYPTLRSAE